MAGGIIINGPSTSNWDHDFGILFLSDWTHRDMDLIYELKEHNFFSIQVENGLINDINIYNFTNSCFQIIFIPGDFYRFRLINNIIEII
jgi:hypothetical protein